MKKLFSHMYSSFLGAVFVVLILLTLDKISTIFPIYIPNIFLKENINYYVNVESAVSESITKARNNVVGVINYNDNGPVSTGSGVVYKLTNNEAYIVTNYHVVENAKKIEIETIAGYKTFAKLIGTDIYTDLAVVSIPKGQINHFLEFSDSNAVNVGDFVIAIGNPLGLTGSATFGIVSNTLLKIPVDVNKDGDIDWYAEVIQTDAAINPGNSGGALINLAGKLIGINSMKIADTKIEGIGFSIPANIVMRVITDLEKYGSVKRPFMGIKYFNISSLSNFQKNRLGISNVEYGLYIDDVVTNSVAYKYGIQANDVILEINNQKIFQTADFLAELYNANIGETIIIKLIRENNVINLSLILED